MPSASWSPRIKRVFLVLLAAGLLGLAAAQDGRLTFSPSSGIVGTSVTANATGLVAGESYDLVWESADAFWNVGDGEFMGVGADVTNTVIATLTADANGNATARFDVPEDYGYLHNVFVRQGETTAARQGFVVAPNLTISPTSGPIGTPITVTLTGVGFRFWESVWHLLYDGAHTGWLSAVTSKGTATAVIPAAGAVGMHTLQVLSGTHPVPYLNQQQAPIYVPQVPTVQAALFEITEGPAAYWPSLEEQSLPRQTTEFGVRTLPAIVSQYTSGTVGSPLVLNVFGFPADSEVELDYSAVRGNRLSGRGWDVVHVPLGTAMTDADGKATFELLTPDDLGGEHEITATSGEVSASLTYTITPSVTFSPEGPVAPGADITITIKGVGWTETANIYTLLMDNGFIGYGCGFNSQGDVTIYLKAPGQVGTHFISLFPAIYQGDLAGPGAPPNTATANATYLQLPMLNWRDHPGEELPAFTLAFEVR